METAAVKGLFKPKAALSFWAAALPIAVKSAGDPLQVHPHGFGLLSYPALTRGRSGI
jgi:hypothetical protein